MKYAYKPLAHLLLAAVVAAALANPAHATGVRAGTLIENTASASYNTGGPTLSVDSNTVTIRVDETLDVAVAWQDAGDVPITGTAVLTFSVTNTGNGQEAFDLTANPAVGGNDFDATIDNLAIDTNGNGVYDAGVDALLANGALSPLVDPDDSITVFVLVTSPSGITDGDTSQIDLLAEAATGTGTPGTTFAGAGEGGGDAVVGSSGADDNALGSLIASIASVSLVKSAVIVDPFGGSEAVPGATVTYTIVASVVGSGSAQSLIVIDSFPADTTYVAGSLTLESVSLTDTADADAGESTGTGILTNIGTLAAGNSSTITFDVSID